MEFVKLDVVKDILDEYGVEPIEGEPDDVRVLSMGDDDGVVHLHLAAADSAVEPRDGADRLTVPADRFGATIEHIIHRLHLSQIVAIPVSPWRHIFDAVAFNLASNEHWQEIDAAATVELNTRDPLVCEPGDFATLIDLIDALMENADDPKQGLILATTAAPVLIEFVPGGALRISLGSRPLADEVRETVAV